MDVSVAAAETAGSTTTNANIMMVTPHTHSNRVARLIGFAADESRHSIQQFKHGAVLCKGGKKYVVVTISIQERHIDKIFVAAFTQKWEW